MSWRLITFDITDKENIMFTRKTRVTQQSIGEFMLEQMQETETVTQVIFSAELTDPEAKALLKAANGELLAQGLPTSGQLPSGSSAVGRLES